MLLAGTVAVAGACNGKDHGQVAVETRLTALDGVDTVSAHAGFEFPESLDITLDARARRHGC